MSAHAVNGGPVAAAQAPRLEAILRRINDEIADRAAAGRTAAFVCECRDRACVDAIELPLELYRRLRLAPNRYAVRPEHVEGAERLVAEGPSYAVVERAPLLQPAQPLSVAR